MTTDKQGRCVHYLIYRKRIVWATNLTSRKVVWELWQDLDTLKGFMAAFVKDKPHYQVRKIRH